MSYTSFLGNQHGVFSFFYVCNYEAESSAEQKYLFSTDPVVLCYWRIYRTPQKTRPPPQKE